MIKIFGGPMFAGKTTALLDHVGGLAPGSFLVVKPSMDIRYGKDVVASHDGQKIQAVNVSAKAPRLNGELKHGIRTVVIDELNFFDVKGVQRLIQDLVDKDRDVVGAGLLYDFMKQPFGATLPVSQIADEFVELFATCDNCGADANHSYRKVAASDQVLVGASESYGACCESCWESLNTAATRE